MPALRLVKLPDHCEYSSGWRQRLHILADPSLRPFDLKMNVVEIRDARRAERSPRIPFHSMPGYTLTRNALPVMRLQTAKGRPHSLYAAKPDTGTCR